MLNAVDVATLGEPDTTESDIAAGWDESGFDVERDAFVAEVAGEVAGYAEVYDRGHGGVIDIDVFVPPDAEPGLTERLLDAALQRVRDISDERTVAATWLPAGDPRAQAFAERGFAAQREFQRMRIDTESAPAPRDVAGIEFAPVDGEGDERAVHDVLTDAFANHVRPVPPSFERFAEQHLRHPDYDPSLWWLARADAAPVGALTLLDHGDLAFIRHIGVRPSHRGRGIASGLILRALARVAERGQTRVDLGVDVEDDAGAAGLYEGLGFRTIERLQLHERRVVP